MTWHFQPYTPAHQAEWDAFVGQSSQPLLLFRRGFVEHHRERFDDHSLLAYEGGHLRALLPACRLGDTLGTHPGLTYGGWITPRRHLDPPRFMDMWQAWTLWLGSQGFKRVVYKPVPWIYTLGAAQTDVMALHLGGARATACHLTQTIFKASWPGFNTMKRRALRKALGTPGLEIGVVPPGDYAPYYALLSHCLGLRHGVRPVHTLEQMQLLARRFPRDIALYQCTLHGEPVAGVWVFRNPTAWHAQYIATNARGRDCEALTLLMHHIIEQCPAPAFDLGVSNQPSTGALNPGLSAQKAALGAGTAAAWRFELLL